MNKNGFEFVQDYGDKILKFHNVSKLCKQSQIKSLKYYVTLQCLKNQLKKSNSHPNIYDVVNKDLQ